MLSKLIIFVDRSLGGHAVADALRAAGEHVISHDERFPKDATDDDWLRETGGQNWIAITKDFARVQGALQRFAVAKAGARLFVLRTTAPLTGHDLARVFVIAAPEMQRLAASVRSPFIAKVYASGEVRLWRDRQTLLSELRKLYRR